MPRFCQKNIPDFATIAAPKVKLTREKTMKFNETIWIQTHEECLSLLEEKFSLAGILKCPDFLKEFAIKVDTSQVDLGAVLIKEYIEGKQYFQPVLCASSYL